MEFQDEDSNLPKLFKTSGEIQNAKLKTYLEDLVKDPYNHWCINCKKNKSTHVVVFIGGFVCEGCQKELISAHTNRNCYGKAVFEEQWDDYQLRSLAHGGNKHLFNILKEYRLDKLDLVQTYDLPAM